jgi:hypothetical protein
MITVMSGSRMVRTVALTSAFLCALSACEGATARSEECVPGDFELAPGGDGDDGGSRFLLCSGDGSAYEPYDGPNPNIPADAPAPDTGAPDAISPSACSVAGGAKLGFMCAGCMTDADCQAGLVCFDFPNKTGNVCTRNCTTANQSTVCPPPSEGCGNNGHCKP